MTIDIGIQASSLATAAAPPRLHEPPALLLATDLDGTFLAGDVADRQQLYQTITRRTDIALVYVTGRGLEAVLPLLADPTLPRPHYIICDVGATVVDGETLQAVQPLQGAIESLWPGEQPVSSAVADHPGLLRQDVPQQRRCSYFCEAEAVDRELRAIVASIGCDLLFSAGRYLDVLPRGVDKGHTLRALVQYLGVAPGRVLVAGDTLNDLSMYREGFNGVCVGEAEHGLVEATRGLGHVLHAQRPGCGGILEAIAHFDLLDARTLAAEPGVPEGKSRLVIAYHRLPYEETEVDGRLVRRPHRSPNGIIPTLLSFFADGREGAWVAWSDRSPDHPDYQSHPAVDRERYPRLRTALVPLDEADIDIFYRRFSKEAFWPLLHTFWERAQFREDHWQVFLRVNRAFAEASAAEAAPGATVWIHDYNLWMVPAFLRELRPDLVIAFFHHTHFPSADVFNVVPWRREIVGSLLQCDYIGFHIPRQVENFVDVARGALPVKTLARTSCAPRFLTYGCAVGLDRYSHRIEAGGREVRLGAHPVGLDVARVRRLLDTPEAAQRIAALRDSLGGRRLLFSVERLDYTKGTLEKLLAYERLLETSPELHRKISLTVVCVPASRRMVIYRELQTQIEQVVGRINGRFSQVHWTPLQFFFRPLPFEELVAWYAVADIMWITPLRDGLNLVAKEYVAVQGASKGSGIVLLSEFAGVAAELKGALLTNPHDIGDLLTQVRHAIGLRRHEARSRLRQMYEIVCHNDIERWGREFLHAAERSIAVPAPD